MLDSYCFEVLELSIVWLRRLVGQIKSLMAVSEQHSDNSPVAPRLIVSNRA